MHSVLRISRSTAKLSLAQPAFLRLGGGSVVVPRQRYSQESYGGHENPQDHLPASRKSRELEHPGPAPPSGIKRENTSQKQQEQQPQQRSKEDPNAKKRPSNNARPTLTTGRETPNVDENGNVKPDVPEDVKRHNQELEQRYDRPYNRIGEEGKVGKGFWKGERGSLTEESGGARKGNA